MTRSHMLSGVALVLLAATSVPYAVISRPQHRPAAPGAAGACPAHGTASEPGGVCTIFAPGTPEDYIQRFQARFSNEIAFSVAGRWTQTATNSSTGGNGTPITLTYGFVPDGVLAVPDGYVAPGVTSIENKLFVTMDAKFGSTAAWQNLLRDIFAEWSALTGVALVEETADDGATWVISPGVLGVRADIRIVCIDEDGPNGVLAFNYYPNFGDMALDAAENWANSANDYRFLRNVVMHELGHGIGLAHVLPRDGTKLMEAFLALGYTGPQDDDIRGAGFSYGDPHEGNNTAGAAADLGAFASGTSFDDMALHSGGDVDWYSVSASAGTPIIARLLPSGSVYAVGPDPGSPTTIDTRAIHRLRLQVYDQDGLTLLSTHTANVAGEGVFNPPVAVPAGDTGLLLRVSTPGGADDIQRYQLTLLDPANAPRALSLGSTPEGGVVC
ncbi:MAG: matrixin family metalloprotease, partial [Phycisphaerae bacterium]|nr:matrixin family metalloprotease [Phycisphaerae bacterium]